MNLIPDDCIQCEIALGGKLRDSQFVNAIKEKTTKTTAHIIDNNKNPLYGFISDKISLIVPPPLSGIEHNRFPDIFSILLSILHVFQNLQALHFP